MKPTGSRASLGISACCLLAGQLALSTACVSDGAVRLAHCIERAAAELESTGQAEVRHACDLSVPGPSTVVAFPASPVSSARLEAEGLSPMDVRTVNELQIGDGPYARINVLPGRRGTRPSRTTYHRRFVDSPALLVCRAPSSRVEVVLRREAGWITLAEIRESQ